MPPSVPEIVEWSEECDVLECETLEWSEPHNVSSEITGYIMLQKSRNDHEWIETNRISGNQRRGTVSGLIQGEHYQFRIIAVTKDGLSQPSHPSNEREARARFSKYILIILKFGHKSYDLYTFFLVICSKIYDIYL